jgi:hypothetical protein
LKAEDNAQFAIDTYNLFMPRNDGRQKNVKMLVPSVPISKPSAQRTAASNVPSRISGAIVFIVGSITLLVGFSLPIGKLQLRWISFHWMLNDCIQNGANLAVARAAKLCQTHRQMITMAKG